MGRPRKNPEDRKDYHLRVPLTVAQLALIEQAVKLDDKDKAEWAPHGPAGRGEAKNGQGRCTQGGQSLDVLLSRHGHNTEMRISV